jgi:hypothetical protein
MRLIWHIFRKDAQRLWLEAALTIGLLAWWAHLDRWRAGYVPGAVEGWLGILLPFAWAYLTGLLVLQDPLVGDRQFWVTLPVGWRSLAAAKALFAVVFILAPYLAALAAILGLRGFQPAAHVPHLLWKELVLLAVIVLPAAALAATLRNVTQFVSALIAATASIIFLNSLRSDIPPFARVDYEVEKLALAVAFAGAAAVAWIQYRGRRPAIARAAGALAAAGAVAIYLWFPPTALGPLQAALHPAQDGALSLRFLPLARPIPWMLRAEGSCRTGQAVCFALPYELSGVPPGMLVTLTPARLTMHGARGETYPIAVSRDAYRDAPLFGGLMDANRSRWGTGPDGGAYLTLRVDRSWYARLRSGPVALESSALADFRRRGGQVSLGVGERADVPGLGKCSSAMVPATYLREETLRVTCESTAEIPRPTFVTLVDRTGRDWGSWLGYSYSQVEHPSSTWLSPLDQRDAFFHIGTEESYRQGPGSQWLVPRDAVAGARIEIRPEFPAGSRVVRFSLPQVDLASYELPPGQ